MRRILKIELYRAFDGIWMKIALLIGLLLGLSHFILRVIPESQQILSNYQVNIAASTPRNLVAGWMGGTINPEHSVYQFIIYILVVLPYGSSYYQDKKSGLLKMIYSREKKINYLVSKCFAVFISGGVVALFPLILNFLLTAMVLPFISPVWSTAPMCRGFFVPLYFRNVLLYYILYSLLIFLYAGLVAGLALSLSLFAPNIFIVLTTPFIVCTLVNRFFAYSHNGFLYGFQLSRIFKINQSGAQFPVGLSVATMILIICGYILFVIKGKMNETY